jgi:hypothetical protein
MPCRLIVTDRDSESTLAICTHRDPPIQIAETNQRDGSGLGARGRPGGPRQCLCVDILTDVRHFAISNGNGEDPMVLEPPIRGFDSPPSEADDQNPVSLRYELGGAGYEVSTVSLAF